VDERHLDNIRNTPMSDLKFPQLLLLLLLLLLLSATELSLGGSSPYTSTNETIIYINETIQKHSKYKHTYYQNTHTLQINLKQPQ